MKGRSKEIPKPVNKAAILLKETYKELCRLITSVVQTDAVKLNMLSFFQTSVKPLA